MKFKNQLILGIITILSVIFFSSKSMAATAIVDTDTLNLRKEASTTATILEQLDKGQQLEVIEETGNWIKVKVSGITGFVNKDYIKIEEEKAEELQNTVNENIISENVVEQTEENKISVEETNISIVREVTLKNNANVYILPLINTNKITDLKKDTKVTVIDEVKGWIYIQTESVNGWIRSTIIEETNVGNNSNSSTNNIDSENSLEEYQQAETNTTDTSNETSEKQVEEKTMYVNTSSIYVRKGPGTENGVVDTLILNSQVIVIGETGDWYKVKVDGKEGYIAKRLLSSNRTESTSRSAEEREKIQSVEQEVQVSTTNLTIIGQEIVNYAKQYLGCKYVYGGAGPSTFDCSGFTMYVYKHFGVSLSHSARSQSKNGTYVAKEDLQPGDLVFFKDYETMDGIGHCGIYIGEGNFIHASSGTGYCVKISTLLSGSYYKRYETARRLI